MSLALGFTSHLVCLSLGLAGHLVRLTLRLASGLGDGLLDGASDFLCSKDISACLLIVPALLVCALYDVVIFSASREQRASGSVSQIGLVIDG